jgi:peptidoglycan hydrolase-like protein with peptidoglycan-binding domain
VKKPKQTARTLSASEISEARELLDQLGYWVDLDAKRNDASLRHALIAFQKIEGRNRTGVLTREDLEALRVTQRPRALETGYPHIEVDLHRQVLFVVDVAGVPLRILPISSGSGEFFTEGGETRQAITPTGRFKVNRKIGGWRKSPLGSLYYPNYFYYGVAIHGNPSVPARPASHGCIRIPMFAARKFSEIATIDMVVIVYDSDPLAEADAA